MKKKRIWGNGKFVALTALTLRERDAIVFQLCLPKTRVISLQSVLLFVTRCCKLSNCIAVTFI